MVFSRSRRLWMEGSSHRCGAGFDTGSEASLPWQWPGLWSVNLPALVLLWQVLWSRSFFMPLDFHQMATSAALVWLFVSAERVLASGWWPTGGLPRWGDLSHEHRAWTRIWLLTAFSLLLVLVFRTGWRELGAHLLLISAGGFYLVCQWWHPRPMARLLPGETVIPWFLTGVCVLHVAPHVPWLPFLPLALLTAMLFTFHLSLLTPFSHSGHPPVSSGRSQGEEILHWLAPPVLIGGSLALALVLRQLQLDTLAMAMTVSGLLLLALDIRSRQTGSVCSRRLADLALLSPLVPLLIRAA